MDKERTNVVLRSCNLTGYVCVCVCVGMCKQYDLSVLSFVELCLCRVEMKGEKRGDKTVCLWKSSLI